MSNMYWCWSVYVMCARTRVCRLLYCDASENWTIMQVKPGQDKDDELEEVCS